MVMKIIKIFTERALFCPEFAASKQAHMTQYLSMIKTNIQKFVSTQCCSTLDELQDATMRREIKIKTQTKEQR